MTVDPRPTARAPQPSSARFVAFLALAAVAAVGTPAHAHRTWLLPQQVEIESGAEPRVVIDAAVSEDLFEFDTNALALEQVRVQRPDGSIVGAETIVRERRRSSVEIALPQPGLYRISAAGESVMASWQVDGDTRRWRGSPDAMAAQVPADAKALQVTRLHGRNDTFVARDGAPAAPEAPDGAAALRASSGIGLELVPLTSPVGLLVGDRSRFRLMLDGQPAPAVDVTVIRGGHRYRYKMGEIALRTDAQGEFELVWPEAGRYWLGASVGPRGPGAATASAASDPAPAPVRRASYSATFEVLPP